MTTQQRQEEASAASVAFQLALAQIGVATIEQAFALWDDVPVTLRADQGAAWLAKAVSLIMTRRPRSRELAMGYYRLVRALRTGRTIADPLKPGPRVVTLDMLRREFRELIASSADLASTAPAGSTAAQIGDATKPVDGNELAAARYNPPREGRDDDEIGVERLDGIATELVRQERDAATEAEQYMQWLGLRNLSAKVGAIDTGQAAEVVDAARAEAHLHAGTRQAAEAERIAMDGARSTTWATSAKDPRVVGYARVSTTGTPCGFCAMLISRGAVYKTAAGAQYTDGDIYHPNCHCVAEPLFGHEQILEDRFELNRDYGELWEAEIHGKYSGKAAVNAWRRLLRARDRASALAARPTTPALEATPREQRTVQQPERERVRVR